MANLPEPTPKTVTVAEAQALLPQVTPLIIQLQGIHRSLTETTDQITEITKKVSGGNGFSLQTVREQLKELSIHQLQLVEAFQSALEQLEEFGCMLKDLSIGLTDFHSIRDGEIILLCWKLGEPRIQYWHTLESGFAGRQPL